jgi:gamma-glutamylcysteine synthetase
MVKKKVKKLYTNSYLRLLRYFHRNTWIHTKKLDFYFMADPSCEWASFSTTFTSLTTRKKEQAQLHND